MKNLYQRLLLLIAGATQRELARHVRHLKIEDEILRSKLPKQVPVTLKEQNRLVKFGAKLGKALSELVTIVHPDTLRRWIRDSQQKAKQKPLPGRDPLRNNARLFWGCRVDATCFRVVSSGFPRTG